mmetsp:Transcript_31725/g.62928  ORF Transcript_31725/g.62928 Transcript_31725/m.62928 type:complete len:217 (-) Transcript_31725:84-734(-)
MLARGGTLVRMLEHTSTPYEYISDSSRFGEVAGRWGASTGCFAPPVVVDGEYTISQSTATCMYVGNRCGLNGSEAFDAVKAQQHLADIVDVFENNLGKKNEDGATLKEFLKPGGRWHQLMGNIEAGVGSGPYYFGSDQPSCVDFFLAHHIDIRVVTLFGPLAEATGQDLKALIGDYPKAMGIYEALSGTDKWKNFSKIGHMKKVSDEILQAYKAAP